MKKTKKKIAKKTIKKSSSKKVKKRKYTKTEIKTIDSIEDFLKIVNFVQLNKEKVKIFTSDFTMTPIIENILRDTSLSFDKRVMKKGTSFNIHPNFQDVVIDVDVKELEDEFLEDGQLF